MLLSLARMVMMATAREDVGAVSKVCRNHASGFPGEINRRTFEALRRHRACYRNGAIINRGSVERGLAKKER